MNMERGWFRIGSVLILSVLFLMVLPACNKALIEVTVRAQCVPEAMRGDDPGKLPCRRDPTTKACILNCPCP
jgi:hypothetical protein